MSNRPYFVHIRPDNVHINPKGGVTVAIQGDEDHGFQFAAAKCHHNDNFVKRVGRDKAAGRLNSGEYRVTMPDDISTLRQAEEYVRRLFDF